MMEWKSYKHLLGTMSDAAVAREVGRLTGRHVTKGAAAKARRRYGIPAWQGSASVEGCDARVQRHPNVEPLRTTPFPRVAAAQAPQMAPPSPSFDDWAKAGAPWDAWPDGALDEIRRAVELNEGGQHFIPLRKMVARLADAWGVQTDSSTVNAYVKDGLGRHSWRVQ